MRFTKPAVVATIAVGAFFLHTPTSYAGDSPAGFWWGSDSFKPVVTDTTEPYNMPLVKDASGGAGKYGIYIGKIGSWSSKLGCTANDYWIDANGTAAVANDQHGDGEGLAGYYYSGGPGLDPNFDGTTASAEAWGVHQADYAIAQANAHTNITRETGYLFLDVDGDATSWNNKVYAPGTCGTATMSGSVTSAMARAELAGFEEEATTVYLGGVYSSPGTWATDFTGSDANISAPAHWPEPALLTADWGNPLWSTSDPGPVGYTTASNSNTATWFGSVDVKCEMIWQYRGSTGTSGPGDFDQFDANREFQCGV